MTPISYRRYSFPSAIIQHAVGRAFAANLRRTRPRPDMRWHLDEVFVSINGKRMYLLSGDTARNIKVKMPGYAAAIAAFGTT